MTPADIRKVGDDYSHYQHGVQISAMCYALADVVEAAKLWREAHFGAHNISNDDAGKRWLAFQAALARVEALKP